MKLKFFLKILLILLVFVIIGYDFGADSNSSVQIISNKNFNSSIEFNVSVQKRDYIEGEPIWFTADIFFDKSIKLDKKPSLHPSNDLRLILQNSKGDTLKYVGITITTISEKNYPDTMFFLGNLLDYFGEPEKLLNTKLGWPYYLPAEKYSVSAVLYLRIRGETQLLNSNKITFIVSKPTGDELNAYNKYLEIQGYRMEHMDDLLRNTELVEEFVRTYPNSAYVEKTRSLLFSTGLMRDNIIEDLKTVILNKPDNGYNNYYLGHMRQICERRGMSNFYESAITEFLYSSSGTLLEKIIRFLINSQ